MSVTGWLGWEKTPSISMGTTRQVSLPIEVATDRVRATERQRRRRMHRHRRKHRHRHRHRPTEARTEIDIAEPTLRSIDAVWVIDILGQTKVRHRDTGSDDVSDRQRQRQTETETQTA